jgi:adenine-specific DNA methylase
MIILTKKEIIKMNYIGSKYSLLDFLETTIEEVTGYKNGDNYVFADLFAGTGIVGQTYKAKGCTVISNDIQYYSYVLNKHYIENIPELDTSLLATLNGLEPVEGFIYKNYCEGSGSGRNYFTNENGMKCDTIRIELERLHSTGQINDHLYFYYLASLVNSIDKYANTASVYGAFLKHIKKSAQKDFQLELLPVVSGCIGEAYNEDINILAKKIHGDVLYLDPPYNARQYCSNYHVLETIARYDNPELSGVTGLRDSSDQKSKFCFKRTVAETFEDLIKNARFKYIFLSYNNEGLMSLDTIKEIMSHYGEYSFFTKEYRRFKADKDENRNIAADSTTEYLHCLIKQ